ncbi:uncharacterized protein AKAW2_21219S [Aspergillus luchuensis]|uniref:Uncharacterized protein n=2 Tax=Aspergillus kawachii TaxID=1069201 RepID=A0A7R7WTD9_ASPKA|nr:uncharacterized protein AKAW2_21219S [Aspergillus luchuensis]BCR96279.1 hypothetical protein AKAW2_21219S [Aspergillus luchuensis]BCS08797.1 hypothetical protein ALUC_21167S [Aspergillus luchuensis]
MKYTDGQVTHYSSQIIDLEANNHSPYTENIPLSTYTTAPTQPCDTPWPGSTQGQTTAQEQTNALEQRPTQSFGAAECCWDCGKLFMFITGFAFLGFVIIGFFYWGLYVPISVTT